MGMGHAGAAMAVMSLVLSTALLVWVNGKTGNPAQKIGKVMAWIAIVVSALLLIGQMVMCASMCGKGKCMLMGGGMGQGLMEGQRPGMMRMGPTGAPPPPPAQEK